MKFHLTFKKSTWIVIVLVFLLPLPSIVSYMQRFVVRNGVVTAYRYEVRAGGACQFKRECPVEPAKELS